jgi:flagellar motor protein MotB
MPRLSSRRAGDAEDDEGYFISMSDMLTGLLFIFIILLLYFAQTFQKTTQELTGANEARTKLLKEIESEMNKAGFKAKAYPEEGVLRLENIAMFKEDEAELLPAGKMAVDKLAQLFLIKLPCFSYVRPGSRIRPCPSSKHSNQFIDTILIEGHTDNQPRPGLNGRDTNIDLSANRSISTYERLRLLDNHSIDYLVNRTVGSDGNPLYFPILSVSGYGFTRPRPDSRSDSEKDRERNRRIDIRFLMVTPGSLSRTAIPAK